MRLYADLADWYPVLTPASDYAEEAAALQPLLGGARSVLELGAGPGHLAHHLCDVELVLTDVSEDMSRLSRRTNPHAEHHVGDMRSLSLGRRFDAVFVHDAIMYMQSEEDLARVFATARAHLAPGGRFVALPDWVAETASEYVEKGGSDAADGRALRYLEWSFQRPQDGSWEMHFAMLLRHADGRVEHVHDVHPFGVFPLDTWLRLLDEAGFDAEVHRDPYREHVFVGVAR